MPVQARLYILDLDGTLIDSLDDLSASLNAMRADFNLPPLAPATVKTMVGQGARHLVACALPEANDRDIENGLALFLAHNEAHLCDQTRLYPGVSETIASLARQGHTLALLSNKHARLCSQLLTHCGIAGHFSAVVGGDSLPSRKPSPEPVRHLLQLLGKQREQTLLVGDSINDMAAGRDAGVITVGCTYGYGEADELADASFRIDTFAELLQLPLKFSRGTP
jgi:phosphoglycolate phosphatase